MGPKGFEPLTSRFLCLSSVWTDVRAERFRRTKIILYQMALNALPG